MVITWKTRKQRHSSSKWEDKWIIFNQGFKHSFFPFSQQKILFFLSGQSKKKKCCHAIIKTITPFKRCDLTDVINWWHQSNPCQAVMKKHLGDENNLTYSFSSTKHIILIYCSVMMRKILWFHALLQCWCEKKIRVAHTKISQ